MRVPITRPSFGDEEERALAEVLRSGWVAQGSRVAEFERLFTAYTGARHAVAVSSGTAALHVALAALGVGPGDEVVVPAFTWIATANVVAALGARPVFVDVELDTFNVDAAQLPAVLTERTKVLLPVSLFGLSAAMDEVLALARSRGLFVVEDDACALGARYLGGHSGTLADLACFSFHPRKAITTGEGGMIVTSHAGWAEACRSLRDHGASAAAGGSAPWRLPEFARVGFNYRLTDLQGALGAVQMTRLDGVLAARTAAAATWTELLDSAPRLRTPRVPTGFTHGWQSYVCLYAPEPPTLENVERLHLERNALMEHLDAAGIATRPGTHAVPFLDAYRSRTGARPQDFPNAWIADRLSIALPLYAGLEREDQERAAEVMRG